MIIKRYYILVFWFLAVLIQFSPFDVYLEETYIPSTTLSNYFITLVFVLFFLMFHLKKVFFNNNAFNLIFILFCFYLINYVFAPFGNFSWLIYQSIFLGVALYIASFYSQLTSIDYESISRYYNKISSIGIIILGFISIYLLINYVEIFKDLFTGINFFQHAYYQNYNSYIYQLYKDFYWDKHKLTSTIAILICYVITFPKRNIRDIIIIIFMFPFIIASRHLLLGFFMTAIFLNIRKKRIIIYLSLFILILIFIFWNVLFDVLSRDIRINALAATIYIITRFPFGVGHGVYHTYVDNIKDEYDYFYNLTGYQGVPIATESDVVFIFGSFGLLPGIIFYIIFLTILFRLWKLYPTLSYPDKYFALVFIYFFFAGIGEDFIFNYPYWIIFGFALGVVTAKRNQKIILQNNKMKQWALN